MPLRSKNTFKWPSRDSPRYYDSPLLGSKPKFYHSFIKNDVNYNVGDNAFILVNNYFDEKQLLCSLKCLFEDRGENKAIVQKYFFASTLSKNFLGLNILFDPLNEVVRDASGDTLINLKDVIGKCRIIFADKDDKVSEVIDAANLNRKIYFLCRYESSGGEDLDPIFRETSENKIDIEQTSILDNCFDKTPAKIVTNTGKPCIKKNLECMEVDNIDHGPHLQQVKRNLNESFNDTFLSEDDQYPHYSVVKSPGEGLTMKLKVLNHKVLTNIPNTQPVVLLHRDEELISKTPKKLTFELKSPIAKMWRRKNEDMNTSVCEAKMKTSEKLESISAMVENLRITNESSIKRSPRKLRKISPAYYAENFSDSDSEHNSGRRKIVNSGRRMSSRLTNGLKNETPIKLNSRRQSHRGFDGDSDLENRQPRYSTRSKKEINYEENYLSPQKKKPLSNKDLSDSEDEIQKQINEIDKKCTSNTNHSDSDTDNDILKNTKNVKILDLKDIEGRSPLQPIRKRTRCASLATVRRDESKNTPDTPKRARKTPLKWMREGLLTPSIDQRRKSVMKANTPLVLARNNLHVSFVPKVLPCREKEYKDIYNFIKGKLVDNCGGCMYISGVPGTGKTATVTTAIQNIITSWKEEGNPMFNYVNINGMKLTEPRQCYVEILKQLTGKRIPWEQALSALEEKFTSKSSKKVVPTVLVVDELDILCTKRQDVVYNLLDWPTKTNAQLIIVTIANTMDLPERLLMSRVTSRLGLTRLTFQAYNHKQLQEIVIDRLIGNNSFKADAIQFVARKVASVSGDARRALDICRRSAEIAEIEGPNVQVSMNHVNAALEAMITQPKVKAIAHCSTLEKILLKSIIAEVERTGIEETTFSGVYSMLSSLAPLEGFKMVSVSSILRAVYRLSSCRLILVDQKCVDFNQRIILNVSSDDVYYALKSKD